MSLVAAILPGNTARRVDGVPGEGKVDKSYRIPLPQVGDPQYASKIRR
ncbi:hypothetical protein IWX63_002502 [Arthrobacter sp. CAN_A2]